MYSSKRHRDLRALLAVTYSRRREHWKRERVRKLLNTYKDTGGQTGPGKIVCLCDLCRSTTMIRYVCVVALSFSSRSSTSSPYSALDWYPGTLHCCVFCAGQYGKCPDSLVDTGKLQQGSKCQGMYYMYSCIHVSICLYVLVCLSVCVSLKSLGITWLPLLTVLEFL